MHHFAVDERRTAQTLHAVQASVQVDHRTAAGPLMQAINILRDHQAHHALLLKRGERPVSHVAARVSYGGPAKPAARPVALTDRGALQEITVLDGRAVEPAPSCVAVGSDARAGTDARASQRHHFRVAGKKRL